MALYKCVYYFYYYYYWGGGVCSSSSIALLHHWLLPINCHFLRLYSAAGRGIAGVSSAIEESDLYLYLYDCNYLLLTFGNLIICQLSIFSVFLFYFLSVCFYLYGE